MSTGYVNSPTVVPSAPCFADLSLNWVMRPASPKPVWHDSTHDSSACCGTCDWTNSAERSGSTPPARYWAAVRRVRSRSRSGSGLTVSAWRSTTQYRASYASWRETHWRSAPM
ncbi:Uncharacterised protein [Mycobacteroides abscessus]|nr:Uncharacterised protein [Mycobacteroides abscessus]